MNFMLKTWNALEIVSEKGKTIIITKLESIDFISI